MRRRALALAGLALIAGAHLEAQTRPAPREQSLRAFLQTRFRADRARFPDTRTVSAFADLDGDGRAEALVYLISGGHCGSGGCTLLVLAGLGRSWREVARTTITNPPVRALNSRSHGWRDLSVVVGGGGIRAHPVLLAYDGRTYPPNPSAPPARALRRIVPGDILISDDDPARLLF